MVFHLRLSVKSSLTIKSIAACLGGMSKAASAICCARFYCKVGDVSITPEAMRSGVGRRGDGTANRLAVRVVQVPVVCHLPLAIAVTMYRRYNPCVPLRDNPLMQW
jgi:hypothetical protein